MHRPLTPSALANLVLLAAMAVHAADHQRQGTGSLTTEVMAGGIALGIVAIGSLPFTLSRSPRAPLIATVVGFWIAFGVIASHVLPHWSAFSDPYPSIGADGWSWAAAMLEVVAAFAFGMTGALELRRQRRGSARTAAASA